MQRLLSLLRMADKFSAKWIEFSTLVIALVFYGPFILMLVVIAVAAPFFALWYAITNHNFHGLYVLGMLVVAFIVTFIFRQRGDDDDPPVKRGRNVLSEGQARNQAKSRLQR